MPEPTMSCVTAKTRGCEDTFTTRIPARPHRQDTTMYTHPYQAASLDHDRHRDIRADISSHRLARHLRDLATAARRARKTPHRPYRVWHPVPRLRPRVTAPPAQHASALMTCAPEKSPM
jgi:hypothetical protein